MTNPRKPSDFDWVTARAQCSPLNMLGMLRLDAEKNVQAMIDHSKSQGREVALQVFAHGQDFGVIRRTYTGEIGVRFDLRNEEIRVSSKGLGVEFTATLTLDDNGECCFLVNGQMLDRWQVLRRVLEPLFFHEP